VNGSIDEENGDGHTGQDIKAKLDESEPDVNSDKVKSRGFVGFFKKFSTKKSTDTCAKNENDTSTDQDTEQLEEDNNETLPPSVDKSNKDDAKHNVSFFRKIGFKKKTPEEINTVEQKTDDDQASNTRYEFIVIIFRYSQFFIFHYMVVVENTLFSYLAQRIPSRKRTKTIQVVMRTQS